MIHTTVRRAALLLACGGTGLALLVGCSSSSSSDATTSAAPTPGVTASATPTQGTPSKSDDHGKDPKAGVSSAHAALGECTKASILAALPAGSAMVKFQCAIASPWMWAAARVKPGPNVFFLQATSGAWKVSKADQICRAPSKSLPKEILAFCPKA